MAIVKFYSCYNSVEAQIIQSKLLDAGINTFLSNENFSQLFPWGNGLPISTVQIWVDEINIEEARTVLEFDKQNKLGICPNCGSLNISNKVRIGFFKGLIYLILSLILSYPVHKYNLTKICNSCNHEFE